MARKKEKRDLFSELMEGLREMKAYREGKIKLRRYRVPASPISNAKKKTAKPWDK